MAKRKRSFTKPKPRDDTAVNPFMEIQKIIEFARQAGRLGLNAFTVFVEDGNLQWTAKPFGRKKPGFITRINCQNFALGYTNNEWRRLQDKIAIEIAVQRKAW